MTREEKNRIIAFLRNKMCGPCRRDSADASHEGCVEAEQLITIVENEPVS